jgi:hypothetical protein
MLFDRCTARPRANLSELPARKGTGVSGVAPKAAPGRFQGDKKADSTGRPGVCDPMNLSFSEMTLAPLLLGSSPPFGRPRRDCAGEIARPRSPAAAFRLPCRSWRDSVLVYAL